MNEAVKMVIESMLSEDIQELWDTIGNEQLWEKGYSGDAPNPHTENIGLYSECIAVLSEFVNSL